MIISLLLYGSRARGDHREDSDVDLLGVVESGKIRREVSQAGVSLYRYPLSLLRSNAERGDLFVLHLTREGKVLDDTSGIFKDLKKRFIFSESYSFLTFEAACVVHYLNEHRRLLASPVGRKRMIWGIRTFAISLAADQREIVFSSYDIANFLGQRKLKDIIDNRMTVDTDLMAVACASVVSGWGFSEAEVEWPAASIRQKKLLRSIGPVAKSTADLKLSKSKSLRAESGDYI